MLCPWRRGATLRDGAAGGGKREEEEETASGDEALVGLMEAQPRRSRWRGCSSLAGCSPPCREPNDRYIHGPQGDKESRGKGQKGRT